MSTLRANVLAFARKQAEEVKRERQQAQDTAGGSSSNSSCSNVLAQISPSPLSLIAAIFDDLSARLREEGKNRRAIVVDMGMGDGRWLMAALDRLPCCHAIGIELDSERITRARQLSSEQMSIGAPAEDRRDIEIIQADFMHVDISIATVVIAYLSREGNRILSGKLLKELKGGGEERVYVVAVGFVFSSKGWKARLAKSFTCTETGLPAYLYEL